MVIFKWLGIALAVVVAVRLYLWFLLIVPIVLLSNFATDTAVKYPATIPLFVAALVLVAYLLQRN
jgi:hypothetical protein